jgi:hypothetical protein
MGWIRRQMPIKPRFFLLDAVIVIELHRLGLWSGFTANSEIVLAGTIIDRECRYYRANSGQTSPIDLQADVNAGRVTRVDAVVEQLVRVVDLFPPQLREAVDPGELEALALLHEWGDSPPRFCTADRKAIEALCFLDLSELGISAEEMLILAGIRRSGKLERKLSRPTFEAWLDDGRRKRIQGYGRE